MSFKNCLIIMTSNLGSAEIFEALSEAPDRKLVKEKVRLVWCGVLGAGECGEVWSLL